MGQMRSASTNAFNLAIETAWVSKNTVKPLITKAYNNALTIAIEKGIINKNTINQLISKAYGSMTSLAYQVKDGLDEDLKKKLT